MKFNAVFKKVPEGDIGFVEELPGANTQDKTLEELSDGILPNFRNGVNPSDADHGLSRLAERVHRQHLESQES